MATSLIYKSAWAYEAAMLVLYGRHYGARYRAVAELVPPGANVLELCCGPAKLYHRLLHGKVASYQGLDLNPRFIQQLIHMGGSGQVWDLHRDVPLPPADCVIMQASLYHFLPDPSGVVDRMLAAARKKVIIAEPIRNLLTSRSKFLAALARRYTNPGSGGHQSRFDEQSLDDFFARYADRLSQSFPIPGGREKVYVLSA